MKKIIIGILLMSSLFVLVACSQKEEKEEKIVHLGIDAEILSVDYKDSILTVVGIEGGEKILQTEVKLNCNNLESDGKLFKTKNSTEVEFLKFNDLKVADKIKLNISEKEVNKEYEELRNVEQIELIEQK